METIFSLCIFGLLLKATALSESIQTNSSQLPSTVHRVPDIFEEYCRRKGNCQPLNQNTSKCMGAKLPYNSVSFDLIEEKTLADVQQRLKIYEEYLINIPKCWAVIQPFLCALYMPKCDQHQVDLPSREMCRITEEPCKIVYSSGMFPGILNCSDERLSAGNCKNDIKEVKFNTTGQCIEPLIKTEKPDWFFKDVEGCGLRCKDSKYTENEQYEINTLISYCTLICIALNLFVVFTFCIDWKCANRYPAKAIFYVNICFAVSSGGYLIQFLGCKNREDIVCKKDGTLRKWEPSATENLSCVIVFCMVYYFLIAGLLWSMIFIYVKYKSCLKALGKIDERVDKKRAYFHLLAWSLPLMLTILTMAIGEIDGDYITGICFISFDSIAARVGLFLIPLATTRLVSIYIIIKGLVLLIKVKIESEEVITQRASRKIQSNIVRMTAFTILMVVFCIVHIGYHVHVYSSKHLWQESLENYVLCKLTSFKSDYTYCKQPHRPSVSMLQLDLLAIFGEGIAMVMWVWCDATLKAWGRYIRKKFHCEVEERMKIQPREIIPRAYANRKKFNEGGKISICSQNHTDPVGLGFELNSAASSELGTTWVKNLPRLVNRRPALPNVVGVDSYNHSTDSDYSVNYRHVSIESRRNSGDSQVSVQIAELTATKRVKARRSRMDRHNNREHSRSASLDSYLHLFNQALTNGSGRPNLNRRTATAGMDKAQIAQLLSNGKLNIPHTNLTCSEDENVSVTISETAVNMRVANQNLDLNDQFMISQLQRKQKMVPNRLDLTESELEEKDFEQEKRYSRSSSRKSKKSKMTRKKYISDSGSGQLDNSESLSSSCPEIRQLVQSSLNSNTSVGVERNRGSRQSKTSMDVAVQANSHDLDLEMKNEEKIKSKQSKTRDNKRFKKVKNDAEEKMRKSKDKYKKDGKGDEKRKFLGSQEADSYV